MRRLYPLFFVVVFFSCDYFEKRKINSEELLKEELRTFNWKDVDEYPTFDVCDGTSEKMERRQCFENTLHDLVNQNLADNLIVVSEELHDTIRIDLLIDKSGNLEINGIAISEDTKRIIPEMDSLIHRSFESLPKIYPAIKRSQPVRSQFVLPILVRIE